MAPMAPMAVAGVTQLNEQMLCEVRGPQASTSSRECLLVGALSPLTEKFFEGGVPIVGSGATEKMCWEDALEDAPPSSSSGFQRMVMPR